MTADPLGTFVTSRAGDRCEYCHLPSAYSSTPFQTDHIVARQHAGRTRASNLALADRATHQRSKWRLATSRPQPTRSTLRRGRYVFARSLADAYPQPR